MSEKGRGDSGDGKGGYVVGTARPKTAFHQREQAAPDSPRIMEEKKATTGQKSGRTDATSSEGSVVFRVRRAVCL